jgi:hypothetical protein
LGYHFAESCGFGFGFEKLVFATEVVVRWWWSERDEIANFGSRLKKVVGLGFEAII